MPQGAEVNLQQVIGALGEKSAEYRAGKPTALDPDKLEAMALALDERAEYFELELEKEQSGNVAQEAELRRALKRRGPVDESTGD